MRDPKSIARARAMRKNPSNAEQTLWQRLRKNQVNGRGFPRQAPLDKFVVDFLCHKPALIIEVDGPAHDDAEQIAFDQQRSEILEAKGFIVLRIKDRAVRERMLDVEAYITQMGERVLSHWAIAMSERRFS